MTFKNLFPLALLLMIACNNNDAGQQDDPSLKGKLPASLVNNPRTLNNADSAKLKELGKLVFTDTLHDFGVLNEGEVIQYEFNFTNKGQQDIIITEAKASCGCTVADFPGRPIKTGEGEKITVKFDSKGKGGMNDRTISVITNGNPAVYNLTIQARVVEK